MIGGQRTRSGKPLLANDPHYSYADAHGNFYPCHLSGAGHSEAGFVFLGTPGMMTGRNDRIAWGFTNNGATIRDLYAEQIDPADPGSYRRGDDERAADDPRGRDRGQGRPGRSGGRSARPPTGRS